MSTINVNIVKKICFVKYLGNTMHIDDLSSSALSNISRIAGTSEDKDHLIQYIPNNIYNELQILENNKTYLIISNSDHPKYTLFSYNI
jgi:hypothetical protein